MTKKPTLTAHTETGSFFGSFYMVLASVCFAVMGILIKKASLKFTLHEYELVFWRVLFALVVLGVQAVILRRSFKTSHPRPHFWRSFIGTLSLFMFFYGITHLPLATAVTFSNTSTIFLAILSIIILKQKPSVITWIALIIGFIGVVMILRPTLLNFGVVPTLIGLGSGVLAGYAYLQVRELSLLGEPSWKIVFYFSLVSTLMAGVASTLKGWTAMTEEMLPYLLGIGVFAMAGQLLMTHAYKVGRKFMVSALGYLGVVLATLYGVWGFDETLSLMTIIGITLVIISGILAGKK
ncbi:MAG: DMT family transporter [Moraxella sp.]|nr:DMT family transporter [Moraxella sp.]